ncbi:IS1634 family transposase [Crinalium epipsammum]|nr:IS1634 family transposase [Crinalium epipsammum]
MLQKEEIEIKNIDHLGIVAGIVDDLGLVEKINKIVGVDSREKISTGQVVKAIILNGLGFVSRPLYLFSQFFEDKAIEHLLGKEIKAEDLNDDKLGRTMDKLYRVGLSELFLLIALDTIKKYQITTKYSHLDSTSLHLHGEYQADNPKKEKGIIKENPIYITQGYSRDHRPDLKQCVMDLIVSSDGDVPLFFRAGDGNESDKAVFGKILLEFKKQIDFESIMVCDSALYSQNNLKLIANLKWISRVPFSLKLAKSLVQSVTSSQLEKSSQEGYSYCEQKVSYGGIEQRWLIVESAERKKSDLDKLNRQIEQEAKSAATEVAKLLKVEFSQTGEAKLKYQEFNQQFKYYQIEKFKILKACNKLGKTIYKIQAELTQNFDYIVSYKQQAGRFILATNCLDDKQLSTSEILSVYKQQQSCERGFRFIKDPLFFADSLFVKNPERVETMMMLMGLCLLVYSIGQRQLRLSLLSSKTKVKNQLGKLTNNPTLRWIFQCFQGIHVLVLQGVKQIINLTKERQLFLQFLPAHCQKYYFSS